MFRILIAEDESASLKYLNNIIEKKCEGFVVEAVAADGETALKLLGEHTIDLLITDIRMPVMDGLKLVERVSQQYPHVISVIVSGHSEFEYAQKAIKAGVTDYLLKPINIGKMTELMEKIRDSLTRLYAEKQAEILRRLLKYQSVDPDEIRRFFPSDYYRGAVIRRGSLKLSNTISKFSSNERVFDEQLLHLFETYQDTLVTTGRDEDELILLTPAAGGATDLRQMAGQVCEKFGQAIYCTAAVYTKRIRMQELALMAGHCYNCINCNCTIGCHQVIECSGEDDVNKLNTPLLSPSMQSRLEFFLDNGKYNDIKEELVKLMQDWEESRRPQLWVCSMLQQFLMAVSKGMAAREQKNSVNIDIQLEQAAYSANSMSELLYNVWEIIERMAKNDAQAVLRQDIKDFFLSIEAYLEKNYTSQLSLQSVCSKFGISQTYLSRLFRRYKNISFNDYITSLRMEQAIRLLSERPDMRLKDIASLVGYNDSAYFSKVFRSYTGMPPSHYQKPGAGS